MRLVHRALLALGAACLVLLVVRIGVASLWRDAKALGAGAALVVGVALLEHWLHALAWGRCFAPELRPSRLHLLGAYLAGGAINLVTPTATLGGDLVRGGLAPRGVRVREMVAAVTADRLAMSIADTLIGLVGFAFLLARGPLSGAARAATAAGAALVCGGVVAFLALQRSGRLASFVAEHRLVRALAGPPLAERVSAASRGVDRRLRSFHAERRRDFAASVALHLAGTAVGALQLAIFLAWLGAPFGAVSLLAAFSVAVALDLFSFFVPARLGAQEGARMLAMAVAGLEPARGLLFSLVLRVEQVVWAGVGLLAYAAMAREAVRRRLVAPSEAAGEHSRLVAGGVEAPPRGGAC